MIRWSFILNDPSGHTLRNETKDENEDRRIRKHIEKKADHFLRLVANKTEFYILPKAYSAIAREEIDENSGVAQNTPSVSTPFPIQPPEIPPAA